MAVGTAGKREMFENLAKEVDNIPQLFFTRVSRTPDRVAHMVKKEPGSKTWVRTSWRKFGADVERLAVALMRAGMQPQDKASVMGDTRPAWAVCDLAILSAGGVSVGLYQTLSPEQVQYIVAHSDSRFVFVQDKEMLEKILAVRDKLPKVEKIIVWKKEDVPPGDDGITSLEDFAARSPTEKEKAALQERIASVGWDDIATIIYTSGTTGPPKGAQISHGNVLAFLRSWDDTVELYEDDLGFHFLPMAHAAEKNAGFYGRINAGMTAAYASALDPQIIMEEVQEVRPTIFGSVPRMFEKAYARIMSTVEQSSPLRREIFRWAERVGREKVRRWQQGTSLPWGLQLQYALADRIVFKRIRQAFGGRVRLFIVGAAPIKREILEFFHAAGMFIIEAYGLTEATVISHANRENDTRLGTVGRPIGGLECRLAEDGEILLKGPTIFKGYYKDEEATREAIDEEGWLHTGDIGEMDEDGYLRITDRKKHIIITAGGKNITPANLENLIKGDPLISQVHVHGDTRPYLSALVTLSEEELPLFAKEHGIGGADVGTLHRHETVVKKVRDVIAEANRRVSRAENVRRFAILERDFTVEENEITPTLKVRRKTIETKYRDLLDAIYAGKAGYEV